MIGPQSCHSGYANKLKHIKKAAEEQEDGNDDGDDEDEDEEEEDMEPRPCDTCEVRDGADGCLAASLRRSNSRRIINVRKCMMGPMGAEDSAPL